MASLGPALRPNQWVPAPAYAMLVAMWTVLVLLAWLVAPAFFPKPGRVWDAMGEMIRSQGLIAELATSLGLFAQSLLIATLLSLGLAYLTVVAAVRRSSWRSPRRAS